MAKIGVSANGLTSEELARSGYNVFAACMGWKANWQDAEQGLWDRVATKAISWIDEAIAAEAAISADSMARTLYAFAKAVDARMWESLPMRQQMIWQAVGRHLCNCLDAEPGAIDIANEEKVWPAWVDRRCEDHKGAIAS